MDDNLTQLVDLYKTIEIDVDFIYQKLKLTGPLMQQTDIANYEGKVEYANLIKNRILHQILSASPNFKIEEEL